VEYPIQRRTSRASRIYSAAAAAARSTCILISPRDPAATASFSLRRTDRPPSLSTLAAVKDSVTAVVPPDKNVSDSSNRL
jgi:hypothetical protein